MKIEAGKFYKTGSGLRVGPMVRNNVGESGRYWLVEGRPLGGYEPWWYKDGTYLQGEDYPEADQYRLVAEWNDAEPNLLSAHGVAPGDVVALSHQLLYRHSIVSGEDGGPCIQHFGAGPNISVAACTGLYVVKSRAAAVVDTHDGTLEDGTIVEFKTARKPDSGKRIEDMFLSAGDIIECVKAGIDLTVGKQYEVVPAVYDENDLGIIDDDGDFRNTPGRALFVIAKKKKLPYGHVYLPDGAVFDMTQDRMYPVGMLGAVELEALKGHGGPYEMYSYSGWVEIKDAEWNKAITYRVAPQKPEPVVEDISVACWMDNNGTILSEARIKAVPVWVKFKRIDDVLDITTYKVEARQ